MSINYHHVAKYLTGNNVGALDRIKVDKLSPGDSAAVITEGGYAYFFALRTDISESEIKNVPLHIVPVTNAQDKTWVLCKGVFSDLTSINNLRVMGNLIIEGSSNIAETLDFHIHKDLVVQDDATVRGDLRVEGNAILGRVEFDELNVTGDLDAQDIKSNKDLVVQDDATVKGDLRVEGNAILESIEYGDLDVQDVVVRKDLVVQDDATIKNQLSVEGRILGTVDNATQALEAQDFKVFKDLIVQDDATVKGDLRVEGNLIATIDIGQEAQDFKVHKDLVVQDDATVKDDLIVEGLIFGTLADAPIPASHDHNYTSPIFDDATVKDDLIVEGLIFGTLADAAVADEAQDFKVFKDLVVQDDATVKGDLRLEGNVILSILDAQDAKIFRDLVVQDDATVKDDLIVERLLISENAVFSTATMVNGNIETGTIWDLWILRDLLVQDDATIKGDIRVEGLIFGTIADLLTDEAQDFKIHKDLVVQDDATVKGDLLIEGSLMIGTTDLFVQSDATVKDDLKVEGLIFGTLADAPSLTEAQDFKVHKDLVVQDDATIKDDLRIENLLFVGQNINALRSVEVERSFLSHDATVLNQMRINDLFIREQKTTSKMIIQSNHDLMIKCETGHYLSFAILSATYLHLENGNSYINEPFEFHDTVEIDKILTLNSPLFLENGIMGKIILRRDTTAKGRLDVEEIISIENNLVNIDGTKGIRYERGASVWDDLRFPASAVKVPGANAPDFASVHENLATYVFDAAAEEYVHFIAQLPHAWIQGTDIKPHIHWTPTDGNPGKIVWCLEYSWSPKGGASFPTVVCLDTTSVCGMGVSHQFTNFPGITPIASPGMSSIIWCRLFRKASHPEDDYGSDAGLLEFDFHIELDSMGSVSEFSKNRQNSPAPGWQIY